MVNDAKIGLRDISLVSDRESNSSMEVWIGHGRILFAVLSTRRGVLTLALQRLREGEPNGWQLRVNVCEVGARETISPRTPNNAQHTTPALLNDVSLDLLSIAACRPS